MNIDRAKNLVILFFIMLNSVLFYLNRTNENRYKLSNQQEYAIQEVLKQNNISLYDHMIKDFYPLKQVELTPYDVNNIKTLDIFFKDKSTLKSIIESEQTIYTMANEKLIIYTKDKSGFLYENPLGTGKINLTKESAQIACDKIIEKFDNKALNLKLDNWYKKDNTYILEYRTEFKGYTIHSSFIRFKITDYGIVQIRGNFFIPESFSDGIRQIYSSDEALYSLMHELKYVYPQSEGLIINKINIVYKTEDIGATSNMTLKADPYYRMYLSSNPEQPFLINAYTNIVTR